MKHKIIGISGLARDGKDSVFKILKKYFTNNSKYKLKKVSLADQLKLECRDACMDLFKIDPINCSGQDKEKIRDFLVFYGKVMRSKSNGTHWTKEAMKRIKRLDSGNDIFCVPDIRYACYSEDECQWIKNNEGVHIHVQKVTVETNLRLGEGFSIKKKFSTPINKEEFKNTPIVATFADYTIEWQDCSPQAPEHNPECVDAVNKIAANILEQYKE